MDQIRKPTWGRRGKKARHREALGGKTEKERRHVNTATPAEDVGGSFEAERRSREANRKDGSTGRQRNNTTCENTPLTMVGPGEGEERPGTKVRVQKDSGTKEVPSVGGRQDAATGPRLEVARLPQDANE